MAFGKIRALYSLHLSFLEMSRLFQIVDLNRPKAVAAREILLLMSPVVLGNWLPRNTKLSTCSTLFPSKFMGVVSGDIILHFAPLIFIPHFLQASSSCFVVSASLSNITDDKVVSSA